jgi:hypothetical protein
MIRAFILTAALGLFASCFSTKSISQSEQGEKQDTLLVLRQTACFGTCPIYTFTILKNGDATYYGIEHVAHVGKFAGKVSDSDLDQIEKLTKELKIKEMKNEYTGYATDLPSTYLTYYFEDQTKKIYAYQNIPDNFIQYVNFLKSLSESTEWKPFEY